MEEASSCCDSPSLRHHEPDRHDGEPGDHVDAIVVPQVDRRDPETDRGRQVYEIAIACVGAVEEEDERAGRDVQTREDVDAIAAAAHDRIVEFRHPSTFEGM